VRLNRQHAAYPLTADLAGVLAAATRPPRTDRRNWTKGVERALILLGGLDWRLTRPAAARPLDSVSAVR
jgi:hypothetical protein